MDYAMILAGGFFLGCLHALDADHVCTVSALILEKQKFRRTFLLALRWSLGHSLTLLVLAAAMTAARDTFAWLNLRAAEHLVGLSMIVLGGWVLFRSLRRQGGTPASAPRAGWVLFGMGVLHGTAGSSAILLLIPAALAPSPVPVFGYVLMFSAGMVMTMGLYAFAVHRFSWWEFLGGQLPRVRCLSGLTAAAIGLRLFVHGAG